MERSKCTACDHLFSTTVIADKLTSLFVITALYSIPIETKIEKIQRRCMMSSYQSIGGSSSEGGSSAPIYHDHSPSAVYIFAVFLIWSKVQGQG